MKNGRCLIICVIVLLSACAMKKQPVTTSQIKNNSADTLLAAIEREPCFGKCPEYYAVIYKSGFIVYTGRKNVNRIGVYTGKLGTNQVQELYNTISLYKMEEKDSLYVNKYLTDYPAWSLWISALKPMRKIHVSDVAPPDDLTGFADYLERVFKTVNWIKVNDK